MNNSGNWKWILVGLAVMGLFFYGKVARTFWKRKNYLNQLETKLEKTRNKNTQLDSEINRFQNDPRIIEQIARRELGLTLPGEIEYRFISNQNQEQPKK